MLDFSWRRAMKGTTVNRVASPVFVLSVASANGEVTPVEASRAYTGVTSVMLAVVPPATARPFASKLRPILPRTRAPPESESVQAAPHITSKVYPAAQPLTRMPVIVCAPSAAQQLPSCNQRTLSTSALESRVPVVQSSPNALKLDVRSPKNDLSTGVNLALSPLSQKSGLFSTDIMLGVAASDSNSSGTLAAAQSNSSWHSADDQWSYPNSSRSSPGKVILVDGTERKKRFECPYCSLVFNRAYVFKIHTRTHTGQKPYQCMICGRAFAQNANVKRHIATHKVWPHAAAKPVQIASRSSDDAEFHRNARKTPSEDDSCILECTEAQDGRLKLLDKCPYCDYVTKSTNLKQHIPHAHSNEKLFQCPLKTCRVLISDLGQLLSHLKLHQGLLTYRCFVCDKEYSSLKDVGVHQHSHVFEEPPKPSVALTRCYRCFDCNESYKCLESLERHLSNVDHSYKCPKCTKIFPTKRRLRKHLSTHSTLQPVRCTKCGKDFQRTTSLKKHMKNHEPTQWTCVRCNAKFHRKDVLKRHYLARHSGNCTFVCIYPNCSSKFKRRDHLRAHEKVHALLADK